MKRRILLLTLALFLASLCVSFSQIKFTVESPLTVLQGDRFQVQFILVNGRGSSFKSPAVNSSSLKLLAGPTLSTSHVTRIINGTTTSETRQTYTMVYEALKPGGAGVGKATVALNGTIYSTKPFSIEIINHGTNSAHSSGGQSSDGKKQGGLATDDILLRLEVSKSSAYKGEAIVATLMLYTRVNITGIDNIKYASLSGFWTQELSLKGIQSSRATINGKSYQSQPVRRWLLFAQKSGKLTIGKNSFNADIQIDLGRRGGGNSIFDQFFGGGSMRDYARRELVSSAVVLNIKDLPHPEPVSFDGAVGNFKLKSSISTNQLEVNSAGTINLNLSGRGNYPLIQHPTIDFPVSIESYDVKSSDKVSYSATGASGSLSWEYPFITRAEGNYDIPEVLFTYFNTRLKKYVTLSSGSFNIDITKSTSSNTNSSGSFISGITKEDLKMLGQDIRFIKTGVHNLEEKSRKFLWSATFFLSIFIILTMFFVMLSLLRKMIKQRSDLSLVKNKQANKVALRRLRKSRSFLLSNERGRFFEEILRSLWGYMGDKLNIDVSDLTKDRVRAQLYDRGASESQVDSLLTLLSECELAQYSPVSSIDMKDAYNQALELISNLEVK